MSLGSLQTCLTLLLMVYSWEIPFAHLWNNGAVKTYDGRKTGVTMKMQRKNISHESNLWYHSSSVVDLFIKHWHGICQIGYSNCPVDPKDPPISTSPELVLQT